MGLVVSSWRRHGHARLYVNDEATREGVGFYDQETGRLTLKDASRSAEVLEVLRPFLAEAATDRADADEPPAPSEVPGMAAKLLRPWIVSAPRPGRVRGERIVDKRLGRLRRDGWAVLSSIAGREGTKIEHLVVGPPGVFTVSTRNHGGAAVAVDDESLTVDGERQPYLRTAREDAEAASRVLAGATGLDVQVTPVLAVVGASSIDARRSAGDVLVVPGEDIDSILRERFAVYSIQERGRIVDAARTGGVWLA